MKTLSQEYASDAYKQVKIFAESHSKDEREDYLSMARGLPILVRQAGLLQALVFVHTRKTETGPQALLRDITQTIKQPSVGDFIKNCRDEADLTSYMWLTRQTLAALEWYKRFAESLLKEGS